MRWPHHSWRDTHQGWIFSIQLKKVFSHVFGTILMRPSRTAAIGGCASVRGVDIPLVGQPGLDHHAAAVAEGRLDRARFGVVLTLPSFVDVGDQEARFLHPLDDQFARAVDAIALEAVEAEKFVRDQPVAGLDDVRVAVEHVEHLAGL